jgi:hypothetical protein
MTVVPTLRITKFIQYLKLRMSLLHLLIVLLMGIITLQTELNVVSQEANWAFNIFTVVGHFHMEIDLNIAVHGIPTRSYISTHKHLGV